MPETFVKHSPEIKGWQRLAHRTVTVVTECGMHMISVKGGQYKQNSGGRE